MRLLTFFFGVRLEYAPCNLMFFCGQNFYDSVITVAFLCIITAVVLKLLKTLLGGRLKVPNNYGGKCAVMMISCNSPEVSPTPTLLDLHAVCLTRAPVFVWAGGVTQKRHAPPPLVAISSVHALKMAT